MLEIRETRQRWRFVIGRSWNEKFLTIVSPLLVGMLLQQDIPLLLFLRSSGLESLKIKFLLENYLYLLEMDEHEWFILFFELTGIGSQIFQDCFNLFITASLKLRLSDL